jgi:hypothetical protein
MGAHRWLRLGDGLGTLLPYFAGMLAIYVLSPFPRHPGAWAIVALIAGVAAAILLGIVIHELGHLLAIRLAGDRPTAVHLLGTPDRFTFHLGALRVGLGLRPRGRVEYSGKDLSAAQDAVIAAADDRATVLATVAMAKHQLCLLALCSSGPRRSAGARPERAPGT